MKALNIILGILTLLLVLACAAGAFFLLEKQDQLRVGWNVMTGAIAESSVALDGGDTNFAAEISVENLGFSKLSALDANLKKFHSQIAGVLDQRKQLATSLHGIALKIEMNNPPEVKTIEAFSSYAAAGGSIVAATAETVRGRDASFKYIADLMKRSFGVAVDNSRLIAGDPSAFADVDKAIEAELTRRHNYEKVLTSVTLLARIAGVSFTGDYKAVETRIGAGIDALKSNYNKTNSDYQSQLALQDRQKKQIAANTAKIAQLDKTIVANDDEMNKFKRDLELPEDQEPPTIWKAGSDEARKKMVGKVIKVSDKYGYIALDIGENTVVSQPFGNRELKINPRLKVGDRLNVARGAVDGESDFIVQVELAEVGPYYSTANIPAESKPIAVGDFVYLVANEK